jgi:hypothetical protein
MKRFWLIRALKCVVLVAAVIAVVGWVVMSLWNALLPALFGWPSLGFVQATGLLILCRLLFGGLRGHGGFGGGMHWRRHMQERWEKMTPEEREKMRSGLRGRCGPWSSREEEE